MSERAAEAIDADALLTRVGSYYHDIGKITRPYYFVENQTDIENPHDKLDPQTSADIITSHTLEGVALGRKYGLPERVLNFMTEHHGTTLVTYFTGAPRRLRMKRWMRTTFGMPAHGPARARRPL